MIQKIFVLFVANIFIKRRMEGIGMEGCPVCEKRGVVTCVEASEWRKLSRERLVQIIEDIIKTKNEGNKL